MTTTQREQNRIAGTLILALCILAGLASVAFSIVLMPVGAAMAFVLLLVAFATRGTNRTILIGFAVLSGLICAAIWLGLMSGGRSEVWPETPQMGTVVPE